MLMLAMKYVVILITTNNLVVMMVTQQVEMDVVQLVQQKTVFIVMFQVFLELEDFLLPLSLQKAAFAMKHVEMVKTMNSGLTNAMMPTQSIMMGVLQVVQQKTDGTALVVQAHQEITVLKHAETNMISKNSHVMMEIQQSMMAVIIVQLKMDGIAYTQQF